MGLADDRSFAFTESRVEEALRLLAAGKVETKADGRRYWRDAGSGHGLILLASRKGGTYYRVHKKGKKKIYVRIGDATTMRVSKAREVALKLAGGNRSAAPPAIRVRTDGPSVNEVFEQYLEAASTGRFIAGRKPVTQSTIRTYRETYRPHLKKLYGGKSLHALARDVARIHDDLRDSPSVANRVLQIIRNVFVFAIRSGLWDGPNPTIDTATGAPIRKHPTTARERWLTSTEAAAMLRFVAKQPDPWNNFWPLLLLVPVRVSTLRAMEWNQLDLDSDNPTWTTPITKQGKRLVQPLTATAVEILEQRLKRYGGESRYVFPMQRDKSRPIAAVDEAWAKVREACNLSDANIHDLRRTTGTWATKAGMSQPAVGKMLGHRSTSSTHIYTVADTSDARRSQEVVEAIVVKARRAK